MRFHFYMLVPILALALLPLVATADDPASRVSAPAQGSGPLERGRMIVYVPGVLVPQDALFDLGPLEGLGGVLLEGNLRLAGRIDYQAGNITAGIFQSTGRGKVLVTLPFTEHATVINGSVKMTDETGASHIYKPGDSYLMKQGTKILWEQEAPLLQKSFLNIVE
jgi:uncharacterized protein